MLKQFPLHHIFCALCCKDATGSVIVSYSEMYEQPANAQKIARREFPNSILSLFALGSIGCRPKVMSAWHESRDEALRKFDVEAIAGNN